jgi:peptidoglycan/xylan/chitin deacetylase (PgdA/CDA1 family)
MKLWIKTHPIVKWLFPKYVWDFRTKEKVVWLTFDDGPIPEVTEWVLAQLEKHNAKATFFCIGDNIQKHSDIFLKVIENGHSTGNHTFNHLNGWKTQTSDYIDNVDLCRQQICNLTTDSRQLMRPPYGKIKRKQARILRKAGYKIIMWDIVSADFDASISPEDCLQNVLKNVVSGSIIVFHDSLKAWKNLEYALPKTLEFLSENGYRCEVPDQICS